VCGRETAAHRCLMFATTRLHMGPAFLTLTLWSSAQAGCSGTSSVRPWETSVWDAPARTRKKISERFQDRARAVIDRWRGSEIDRAWRDGFVPLGGLDIAPEWLHMPDWVGVSKTNGAWGRG
jgi:hypothetical protein